MEDNQAGRAKLSTQNTILSLVRTSYYHMDIVCYAC